MVKLFEVAVEATGTERSVQELLSVEPCNLKVFAVLLDNAQETKSKVIPVIGIAVLSKCTVFMIICLRNTVI